MVGVLLCKCWVKGDNLPLHHALFPLRKKLYNDGDEGYVRRLALDWVSTLREDWERVEVEWRVYDAATDGFRTVLRSVISSSSASSPSASG